LAGNDGKEWSVRFGVLGEGLVEALGLEHLETVEPLAPAGEKPDFEIIGRARLGE
jgi:hypothetical protein